MCFGLCDFVFMVRELQVSTAGMDVDGVAQELLRHAGALNVPARTAHAPWGFPCDFVIGLSCLPQCEVQRIFLLFAYCDSGTCNQVFDILTGQLAVADKLSGSVIYVTVHFVSVALFNQVCYELYDFRNGLGNLRMYGCLSYIQSSRILVIFFNILFAHFRCGAAFFTCTVDDLVINVSKVLNELYLVAAVFQILSHSIEHYERSCITDVEEVVYGRTADIHLHLARFDWNEFFFSSGQGIINFHLLYPLCTLLCMAGSCRPCRFLHEIFLLYHASDG